MAFVRVPDPNLEVGKPGRSTDIKQIRDNQDDHEARIIAVEDSSVRAFSHFSGRKGFRAGGAAFDDLIAPGGGGYYIDYDRFFLYSTHELYNEIGVSNSADNHYLKWYSGAGTATAGQVIAEPALNFTSRTKPITFNFRAKFSDALNNPFHMGLRTPPTYGNDTTPSDGIWLEQNPGDHTKWRFLTASTVGGGTTTGGNIARPADAAWFECKIIFTDSPGNRALCYLDGVLYETFTTANALATTMNLYGCFTFGNTGLGDSVYLDRALVSAAGTLGDAA